MTYKIPAKVFHLCADNLRQVIRLRHNDINQITMKREKKNIYLHEYYSLRIGQGDGAY